MLDAQRHKNKKIPEIHQKTASPQISSTRNGNSIATSGCAYFKGHEVEATVKALHSKIVLLRKPIELICLEPQPIHPSFYEKQDASTRWPQSMIKQNVDCRLPIYVLQQLSEVNTSGSPTMSQKPLACVPRIGTQFGGTTPPLPKAASMQTFCAPGERPTMLSSKPMSLNLMAKEMTS